MEPIKLTDEQVKNACDAIRQTEKEIQFKKLARELGMCPSYECPFTDRCNGYCDVISDNNKANGGKNDIKGNIS